MERQFFGGSPIYGGYGMGYGGYPFHHYGYGGYPFHHHGYGGYPFHHHGYGGYPFHHRPWIYRDEFESVYDY
ncbi:hypothetical protein R4Z10_05075 [Niallia sp. XMNu-256]|uniref:hypothetical protein n=1 Tax=Niallia sp. XMNu-256 TaxID=3082444 RepID=UPI0030CEF989